MIGGRFELVSYGTVPATGPLILNLGNPLTGNEWDLRRIVVMDSDSPTTAHACTIFIVTPKGAETTFEPSEVADVNACGLPAAGSWSRGTIVFMPLESVELFIYGLTPGLNIIATGQVENVHQ